MPELQAGITDPVAGGMKITPDGMHIHSGRRLTVHGITLIQVDIW